MMRLMLKASVAGAALFAGASLAHAQSVPPAGPPVGAEVAPAPADPGGSIDNPTPPPPPVVLAPDDDSDED